MWGGRFAQPPDETFDAFQRSFGFDHRLLPYELAANRAWARALTGAGILSAEEADKILAALEAIAQESQAHPAAVAAQPAEDVHSFVERQLIARLGELGAKLHTGRSRNDLVATDFRLFIKDAARAIRRAVASLAAALAAKAEAHLEVPMAGHTHLQHAQPILLSHYLLAHGEAFLRDAGRLGRAIESADACPLGAGALAGCAFPVDRWAIAHTLGFARITENSLDAVSDRDFALDYLFALAVLAMHLSRLAEDMVLFASPEFGFVILPDAYSTGSSLMPQKKNPDAWELIRGKAGRIFGALTGLLVTLKGLPAGYQRDLQEDKENVFTAHDQALAMTHVAAGAIAATQFNAPALRRAAADPALLATEAADFLVARGVPFRQAHEIVGQICREAERQGVAWTELPLETLRTFSPLFDASLRAALTVEAALARRSVPGGTAPTAVRRALEDYRARLRELEASL
jgi:argininosuccinate lyase